jgi:hypothetical protein
MRNSHNLRASTPAKLEGIYPRAKALQRAGNREFEFMISGETRCYES